LCGDAFVGETCRNEEFAWVHAVVFTSVGNSGVKQLGDRHGRSTLTELKNLLRTVDLLTTNEVENGTDLVCREAEVAELGSCSRLLVCATEGVCRSSHDQRFP